MRVNFRDRFMHQLGYWRRTSMVARDRILRLARAAAEDPFHGVGDPRLVKELGRGVWARHISGPHFLIYMFELEHLTFISCRAYGGF